MKITIIGSGNVAYFLSTRLKKSGYIIQQVYSRNLENAKLLAKEVGAQPTNNLDKITDQSDIYILAIKDDAIRKVATSIPNLVNKLIIHCSGASNLDILEEVSKDIGVIWPVYSIKKESIDSYNNIPIVYEASNKTSRDILEQLAAAISDNILSVNYNQRKTLHLNSVLVNNFTNHLIAISYYLSNKNDIPFDILKPIINQTIEQIGDLNPQVLQTGPAMRQDFQTINKHLGLLMENDSWKNIYEAISKSIMNTKGILLNNNKS